MKTRILAAAIAMGSAGLAQAQQIQATISYQLSFTDVLAGTTTPGNGNGIIEPWEGAHIRLTALMTPPVGSNVPTTLTPSGTAQLRGIMSIFLDLQGTIDAHGVWSHLRIDPNWDLLAGQGNGTPVVGGTQLQNIQAGNFRMVSELSIRPIPS